MRAVVLLSGGMDSVTALYQAHAAGQLALALSFDYGARHHAQELRLARRHAAALGAEHVVIPLDFIRERFASHLLEGGGPIPKGHYEDLTMKQTVVPFRNGIMLSIAAGLAESRGSEAVIIAAHSGDHAIYPDCREDFMLSMGAAIRLGTWPGIALLRPFIRLDKAGIALLGRELGVDFAETWSCYEGGELHCGECGTCVERREAFLSAGLPDPTVYLRVPPLPQRSAIPAV